MTHLIHKATRYTLGLLLACISGFSGPSVLAAMIEGNDPRYGTGNNTTIDAAAGLEWLDWSITKQPYDLLQAQLVPGGTYEGWRLATDADVVTLLSDLGLPKGGQGKDGSLSVTNDGHTGPNLMKPLGLMGQSFKTVSYDRWGSNWHEVISTNYEACYADQKRVRVTGTSPSLPYPEGPYYYLSTTRGTWQTGRTCGVYDGWALVRQVPAVPEPSGLAMLCVVAPALMRSVWKRRKFHRT